MTNNELFLEIRRIIREELELALNKPGKRVTMPVAERKVPEKKQGPANDADRIRIKEKLASIRKLQEQSIDVIDYDQEEEDGMDEVRNHSSMDLNQTRQAVLENINRDYSQLVKKLDKA